MPIGRDIGLVDDVRWTHFERRRAAVGSELLRLGATTLVPDVATNDRLATLGSAPLRKPMTLWDICVPA